MYIIIYLHNITTVLLNAHIVTIVLILYSQVFSNRKWNTLKQVLSNSLCNLHCFLIISVRLHQVDRVLSFFGKEFQPDTDRSPLSCSLEVMKIFMCLTCLLFHRSDSMSCSVLLGLC